MGARVYLASIGRFLQVDPVEGGTDNNYAYVNDPVNDFDLDGRMSTAAKWGIGIGVGVAAIAACVFGGCEAAGIGLGVARVAAVAAPTVNRIASWAWTKGQAGSRMTNMLNHFAKHGKAMGYKTPMKYTLGALGNLAKFRVSGVLQSGATAYIRGARTTIVYGSRIASYSKAKNSYKTLKWLYNNLRR